MSHFDVKFLDKNSERYMLSKRIMQFCSDIKSERFITQSEGTGDFLYRDGQYTFAQRNEGEWTPFDCDRDYWGYRECYCWFKQTVKVPAQFAGQAVYYKIIPYLSEWRTTNPQLIIYVNGKMIQGMDSNHQDVIITNNAKAGEEFEIYINAHADAREFKSELKMKAQIFTVDPIAVKLYFDLITPLEVANLYSGDSNERVNLVKALNTAVNMVDLDAIDVEDFRNSAKNACDYLEKEVYGKKGEATAYCVGHTHIDVAWLWRLRQTRDKTGRSFATVLKYMEEYPNYIFMSPQAQLYDFVKHDYPELYEGIKQRIKEGRWEAEGSMWVEADTNVASGEALVRQFLVGKRFFRNEFGVDNKIMWLPDVFGYSAALPQIIKKSGIDYFMTTKISWNEYNRLPFDTFRWQGIDGTKVLSHFSPGGGKSDDYRESFQTTYNVYLSPRQIIGGYDRYGQKDLGKNYLISYGHGDGGGGPTREMLEHDKRMAKGIEGCPVTVQSTARNFFEQLQKDVSGNRFLPIWVGELYLEFHRGTLTSEARNKKYNRKSECLYHDVETLSAIAGAVGKFNYPHERLLENWKLILLNQFHDILPGSSIPEVYKDSALQYEEVLKNGRQMLSGAINAIVSAIKLSGNSFVVFNTLGFERKDIACTDAPKNKDFKLLNGKGEEIPYQIYDGKIFFIAAVPAKGWSVYTIAEGSTAPFAKVEADIEGARTDAFLVDFDENLNIEKLLHKDSGRSVSGEKGLLGKLIAFEDRPHNHDAWDIKCYFEEKSRDITQADEKELVTNGPVMAVYKAVRSFRKSKITQYIYIYKALPRIDIKYVVDWKDSHIALKADYPVDVNANRATFDIQFGNLERSTTRNTSWDFAQFEVSMHKWADLSDRSFGFAVINDCKYGVDVKDGHIRPTLLRSPVGHHPLQDKHLHEFTFSLYPHEGGPDESNLSDEGYNVNFPLYVKQADKGGNELEGRYSFINASASNIVIETIKVAEDSDSIIVRAFETWNKKTPCSLTIGATVVSASECNLMEENDVPAVREGNQILTTFKPYEIKTFKIKIKK
ncbi:MAG: alpha-mannosidase [Acutalibacteraceae bacterium]